MNQGADFSWQGGFWGDRGGWGRIQSFGALLGLSWGVPGADDLGGTLLEGRILVQGHKGGATFGEAEAVKLFLW